MILDIDTKDQKLIKVSLKQAQTGKIIVSLNEENKFGSQVLLPLIEKILTAPPVKTKK